MKLLNAKTLQIHEFIGQKNIPPYVILSHTWGDDEVSFQHVQTGNARSKQGFTKIVHCCQEAIKDGIEYAWVDTCCIDKTSSAELSEAINSMFQWYRLAVRCYAYLSDLPSQLSARDIAKNLPSCRWFTRGWTLQELLAPRELIFFAKDWTRLGERCQWAYVISEATSIHAEALTGSVDTIRAFSVAQKFSWASKRSTTREEDMAYCLLGLFDCHIPLLYGEGSQAFRRLQEEILKTDDQTIFAWRSDDTGYSGLLAPSPIAFKDCTSIAPFRYWKSSQPYEITNAGLRINASLIPTEDSEVFHLILRCYDETAPERILRIPLSLLSPDGDQFARKGGLIYGLEHGLGTGCQFLPPRTIYIRNDNIRPEAQTLSATGKLIQFRILVESSLPGYTITHAWPPSQWDQRCQMLKPPNWSTKTRSNWPDYRLGWPEDRSDWPDPTLFNWSWRAALLVRWRHSCNPSIGGNQEFGGEDFANEELANAEFIVVIGYNGRNDQCWCAITFGGSRDLQNVLERTPYSGVTQMHRSLPTDCFNSPPATALVTLLVPEQITPRMDGQPFEAVIRID
jgi:Heterokaryon incompatibility protein (HET)